MNILQQFTETSLMYNNRRNSPSQSSDSNHHYHDHHQDVLFGKNLFDSHLLGKITAFDLAIIIITLMAIGYMIIIVIYNYIYKYDHYRILMRTKRQHHLDRKYRRGCRRQTDSIELHSLKMFATD
ncbi:uncharacterized protein LOC124493255 [Dermatophagoides farinae]|uniref:Uncharacterized protein n=1 Tax=Dermatophagoides farinae TaxID=6954 RepID=A0A922KUD7_DERFA|nr:uncharacterized protein LOC124493255 [Dermatophagoides farinae]KAH7643964.1 hypothetical protein HUG17_6326 [Dermatophagoides farinae]KAH9496981.1 hypothetical protein DERF_013000 [Dermatophagoides farinae]